MKTVISQQYERSRDFLLTIPQLMTASQGETIYQKRNVVSRFEHGGQLFVAKQFKRPNAFQRLVYSLLRPSKAERAYRFAARLRSLGIETPREVAYMENYSGGLFADSWFVSEWAEGTETHLLLREVADFSHQLADAVAAYIVKMHSQGVLHGDLNLSNFLCSETAEGYRFSIIDTNRSRFCQGWPSRKQCIANLVRLTHRRDLYDYLVRSYARQRGWDEQATAQEALRNLHRFEHRIIK